MRKSTRCPQPPGASAKTIPALEVNSSTGACAGVERKAGAWGLDRLRLPDHLVRVSCILLLACLVTDGRSLGYEPAGTGGWYQAKTAHTPGKMKGVFVGRLAGFVTWPEKAFKDKQDKLRVVFIGDDSDGVETGFRAEVIAKKNSSRALDAGGRYFAAQHLNFVPESKDSQGKRLPKQPAERLALEKAIRECHVIYISAPKAGTLSNAAEKLRTIELLQLASTGHQLTLGESPTFCEWGGMARLFVSLEKKLSFDINLPPMRKQELLVHSRILDFARKTYR